MSARSGNSRGRGAGKQSAKNINKSGKSVPPGPLDCEEYLAPLFHDTERGAVMNIRASPKDVSFDGTIVPGRPHGHWQGCYSLAVVADGRPKDVQSKKRFTPLTTVVDRTCDFVIFLVMSYDEPTKVGDAKHEGDGFHLSDLLRNCTKSKFSYFSYV